MSTITEVPGLQYDYYSIVGTTVAVLQYNYSICIVAVLQYNYSSCVVAVLQ